MADWASDGLKARLTFQHARPDVILWDVTLVISCVESGAHCLTDNLTCRRRHSHPLIHAICLSIYLSLFLSPSASMCISLPSLSLKPDGNHPLQSYYCDLCYSVSVSEVRRRPSITKLPVLLLLLDLTAHRWPLKLTFEQEDNYFNTLSQANTVIDLSAA